MNVGLVLIAIGVMVVGTALGISIVGAAAVSAVGRQPEATGRIMSVLLLVAALIEGLGLFGIVLGMNSL